MEGAFDLMQVWCAMTARLLVDSPAMVPSLSRLLSLEQERYFVVSADRALPGQPRAVQGSVLSFFSQSESQSGQAAHKVGHDAWH